MRYDGKYYDTGQIFGDAIGEGSTWLSRNVLGTLGDFGSYLGRIGSDKYAEIAQSDAAARQAITEEEYLRRQAAQQKAEQEQRIATDPRLQQMIQQKQQREAMQAKQQAELEHLNRFNNDPYFDRMSADATENEALSKRINEQAKVLPAKQAAELNNLQTMGNATPFGITNNPTSYGDYLNPMEKAKNDAFLSQQLQNYAAVTAGGKAGASDNVISRRINSDTGVPEFSNAKGRAAEATRHKPEATGPAGNTFNPYDHPYSQAHISDPYDRAAMRNKQILYDKAMSARGYRAKPIEQRQVGNWKPETVNYDAKDDATRNALFGALPKAEKIEDPSMYKQYAGQSLVGNAQDMRGNMYKSNVTGNMVPNYAKDNREAARRKWAEGKVENPTNFTGRTYATDQYKPDSNKPFWNRNT